MIILFFMLSLLFSITTRTLPATNPAPEKTSQKSDGFVATVMPRRLVTVGERGISPNIFSYTQALLVWNTMQHASESMKRSQEISTLQTQMRQLQQEVSALATSFNKLAAQQMQNPTERLGKPGANLGNAYASAYSAQSSQALVQAQMQKNQQLFQANLREQATLACTLRKLIKSKDTWQTKSFLQQGHNFAHMLAGINTYATTLAKRYEDDISEVEKLVELERTNSIKLEEERARMQENCALLVHNAHKKLNKVRRRLKAQLNWESARLRAINTSMHEKVLWLERHYGNIESTIGYVHGKRQAVQQEFQASQLQLRNEQVENAQLKQEIAQLRQANDQLQKQLASATPTIIYTLTINPPSPLQGKSGQSACSFTEGSTSPVDPQSFMCKVPRDNY